MKEHNTSTKVKEISELLYNETILPSKEEAKRIIEDAKKSALEIVQKAKEEEKNIIELAELELKKKQEVFDSSLTLAVKQTLENLKSKVMSVFNQEFQTGLSQALSNQEACEEVVKAMVEAIKKEGISSNLKLSVSENLDFDKIAKAVAESVKEKVEKSDVPVSHGVALAIVEKKVTLKVTEKSLSEILADHLPEVLRGKVFA